MREQHDAFHLAIPARDLDEAEQFYVAGLGCKLARRYEDRVTLDFFGDQVVCHLSDCYEREPELYPRHFGVTFARQADFEALERLFDRLAQGKLGNGATLHGCKLYPAPRAAQRFGPETVVLAKESSRKAAKRP